jgi:hypothetical protein
MDAAVRALLISGADYQYCHLVKFERPSLPDSVSGKVSTSKERYAYITDASMDVLYDDGSFSLSAVANGTQKYVANKLLSVGNITEETEAKASSVNIDLDGTAIGATVAATVTTSVVSTGVYDIVFPPNVDLIYEGFREGDKVTLTGISAPGDYRITGFRFNNTLRLEKIDTTLVAEASVAITMSLSSDEVLSILTNKSSDTYASFLNRYVSIWKAYFVNGAMVGTPVLRFKGVISSVGFEDSETMIKVSWGISSHWGDWSQVSGRITSDDFHRALDSNGNPNPLSTIKPLYAYDKGFIHSETSLSLLAKYNVQVQQQKVTSKSGFFGLFSKVSVRKFMTTEERSTNLDFQLTSKNIPVVYGVRPVQGIPVFVDTLNDDASVVYAAYALCEGEIGAVYDMYIDGNSLICGNKADFDARNTQTADNTVPLVCRGRADRGDVLGGAVGTTGGNNSFYGPTGEEYLLDFNYNLLQNFYYPGYTQPTTVAPVTQKGVVDGETIFLSSPQEIAVDLFSGKPGQAAAASLVGVSAAKNFKIQNDYWIGKDTVEYWGPNHRLLDTAYVVTKTVIKEGETTTPNLEFIVKGKAIDCYNYDYSYSHYRKLPAEDAANFLLGDTVALHNSVGDAIINASVQIIDKFTIYDPDGTPNTRFRFSIDPALGYNNGVPAITKFYMLSGANKWTMVTYNYKEFEGAVSTEISSVLSLADSNAGDLRFTYATNTSIALFSAGGVNRPVYSIHKVDGTPLNNEVFSTAIINGRAISNTVMTTDMLFADVGALAVAAVASAGGAKIVSRNCVRLAGGASAVDGYYNGHTITVTTTNATTGKQIVQEKTIVDYDGDLKIAIVNDIWDEAAIPNNTSTYYIQQPYSDKRSSTNFALITADYIGSKIYGKGLVIGEDLNFNSVLEAARTCDERSDVTIRCLSNPTVTPTVGAVYKLTNTATKIIWQGTVSGTFTSAVSGASCTYVTFTNNIGKMTREWNSWATFAEGEYVYYLGNIYKANGSYTPNSVAPVHVSGLTVNNLIHQTTAAITKVTGTGDSSLALFAAGNPVQSVLNGRISSGYSLYDSDGIEYWRYVGWESKDQRWVTRHQGNITLDTSQPVFDNTNSLLALFGGILRFNGGQYFLEVKTIASALTAGDPAIITEDMIIGRIKLQDEGVRSSYNSLAVSYADPSNKFEARNISFFNSDYLKADRNVPRKGSLSIPGITNYYNARLLADRYLSESRFGMSLSLTLAPRGLLLLPGSVIEVPYTRYGWNNKQFRIESMSSSGDDCLIDIVAKEYDDSFYTNSNIKKQKGTGAPPLPLNNVVAPPTGLTAAVREDADYSSVAMLLRWTNSDSSGAMSSTEVYGYPIVRTVVSGASNIFTTAESGDLSVNDELIFYEVGTTGLTSGVVYYARDITATTFKIAATAGGVAISFTGGTYTLRVGRKEGLTNAEYPSTEYLDIAYNTSSLDRYYKIRHKVVSGANTRYSEFTPVLLASATNAGYSVHVGDNDESIHFVQDDPDYIGWFGSLKSADAPTKLKKDGTLQSKKLEQRDSKNNLIWSSEAGHTPLGVAKLLELNKNSLPSVASTTLSIEHSTSISGVDDPVATKVGHIRLGAKSDVTLELEFTCQGTATTDTFASQTMGIYQRDDDALTGLPGNAWTQLGSSFTIHKRAYRPQITVTSTGGGTTTFTSASVHGLFVGQKITLISGPSLPPGDYWIRTVPTTTTFTLVSTPNPALGGTTIPTAGSYVFKPSEISRSAKADSLNNRLELHSASHGLVIGQKVRIDIAIPGSPALAVGEYWVRTIPSSTKFTLSATPGLEADVIFTDGVTSVTLLNQYVVTPTYNLGWEAGFGDLGEFVPKATYNVPATKIEFSIANIRKANKYFQYAIVGPTAAPFTYTASTLTATDTDSKPSLILSDEGSGSVNFTHPLGSYTNIVISNTTGGNAQVSVAADMVVTYTPAGLPRTIINLSKTLNLGITGVNGRDAGGSITASVWYYIWAISDGTVEGDGVIGSLSSTNPIMPADYTYKRLLGACRINASSFVKPFLQQNNKVTLINTAADPLPSIVGTQGSDNVTSGDPIWAAIDWSSSPNYYLPTNAFSVIVSIAHPEGGSAAVMGNASFGNVNNNANPPPLYCISRVPCVGELGLESSNIYYGATGDADGGFLRFLGYTLKL